MASPDLALQIKNNDTKPYSNTYLLEEILPDFIRKSAEFKDNKYAVRRTKQWVKLLGRTYPFFKDYFEKVKLCQNTEDLRRLIAF